jgi:hypothetical protein
MFQLVLKDLKVQKGEKTIFIALFLSLCISGIIPHSPGLASIQLLLGVYLMIVYANAYDYKYNAEIMINSLPLDRKQIVRAKYLSAICFSLIMIGVALPASAILSHTGIIGDKQINLTVIVRFLMTSFFFLCIYLSIFFPVYFKLGYLKSRWANFLSFFIIFGLIGFSGSQGAEIPQHAGMLQKVDLLERFLGILAGNASIWIYGELAILGLFFLYISMQISKVIYSKKEF